MELLHRCCFCSVVWYSALYCIVLYCTVLYCNVVLCNEVLILCCSCGPDMGPTSQHLYIGRQWMHFMHWIERQSTATQSTDCCTSQHCTSLYNTAPHFQKLNFSIHHITSLYTTTPNYTWLYLNVHHHTSLYTTAHHFLNCISVYITSPHDGSFTPAHITLYHITSLYTTVP